MVLIAVGGVPFEGTVVKGSIALSNLLTGGAFCLDVVRGVGGFSLEVSDG